MRNIERFVLTALVFIPLILFGKEGVFITFEPLKDWKPRITLKGNIGGGNLKVEYKLFGTTKVKYKFSNSLTAGLKFNGLSLPSWNIKPDSKLMAIVRGFEGKKKEYTKGERQTEPILCSANGKSLYCSLGRKGKEAFISIGRSFKDFTLILFGDLEGKKCTLLNLESIPNYTWLRLSFQNKHLLIEVGDKNVAIPLTDKKVKLALLKKGKNISFLLGEGVSYTLRGAEVVYLHRAVLNENCLRNWKLYLYPSAKGRETIFLTFFGN